LLGATVVQAPASTLASTLVAASTVASAPASTPPELVPPELVPPELVPPELVPPELEVAPLSSSSVVAGGAGAFWLGGVGSVGCAVSVSPVPTSALSPLAQATTSPAPRTIMRIEPTVPRENDDAIAAL
jgi:hypothetical protein